MDMRRSNNFAPNFQTKKPSTNPTTSTSTTTSYVEGKKIEYSRSYSQVHGRRMFPTAANYFSMESLLLLSCLTASLLILPLILPPLPPPPFMLLLLPIGIMAMLMIFAFMPSNVRDLTYTYV